MHGDKPIHVAHEWREALPGALAIGLSLGVGQTLQHGRGPRLLLPFLLEPLPLGVPLLALLLVALLPRRPDSRGRPRSAASESRSAAPAAGHR